MADVVSRIDLENAKVDTNDLGAIVNGAPTAPDVVTRLGQVVRPVAKVIAAIEVQEEKASTSAAAALGHAGSASNSAASALASKGASEVAAQTATTQAGLATTASQDAIAIAGQGGIPKVYNTKADANAALAAAGIAANEIVMVLADESDLGDRNLYRNEAGVLVRRARLDYKLRRIHVDSISGNDANDGATEDTPLKSLTAAIPLLTDGCVLRLSRGSIWYAQYLSIANRKWMTVEAYGQGNKPQINASTSAWEGAGWTQDGVLWYRDIIFAENLVAGTRGVASNTWHIALWDEGPHTRPDESGIPRSIDGSIGQLANIAALRNKPGHFYALPVGYADAESEPRGLATKHFRFYYHPADGTNPNTNGRTLRTTDAMRAAAWFGPGTNVSDVVFRRCGGKDMVSVSHQPIDVGVFERCEMLEAGCHAIVGGGIEFRNCKVGAAYHDDPINTGGGGFHNFRGIGSGGTSRGFTIYDCEAEGFGSALYSHGDGSATPEHDRFDIDGFIVKRCNSVIAAGLTMRGSRSRRIRAFDISSVGVALERGTVVTDSEFYMRKSAATIWEAYGLSVRAEMIRCFVYFHPDSTGSPLIIDPFLVDAAATVAQYPTVTLRDTTVAGPFPDPGNSSRFRINLHLKNSVLTEFKNTSGLPLWITGEVTVDANSSFEVEGRSGKEVREAYPNVNAAALTGTRRQTFTKTVAAADIKYFNAVRTISYAGAANADGTANLTLNHNDGIYRRWIRVIDAYGAGLHYEGRVVDPGAVGLPMVVTPAPTAAFADKAFAIGVFRYPLYRDPITASISFDGSQLAVPDGTLFNVGMTIRVGKVGKSKSPLVRKVAAINGNILTLDTAVVWASKTNQFTYNNIDGSGGRRPLPTVDISWEFVLLGRNHASQTAPSIGITLVEGGTFTAMQTPNGTTTFSTPAALPTQVLTPTTGEDTQDKAFDIERGFFNAGPSAAIGDILTFIADAEVEEEKFAFLVPPEACKMFIPDPSRLPVKRGSGYRGPVVPAA